MSHFHSEINQIMKRREFKFYDHDNVSVRKLVEKRQRGFS